MDDDISFGLRIFDSSKLVLGDVQIGMLAVELGIELDTLGFGEIEQLIDEGQMAVERARLQAAELFGLRQRNDAHFRNRTIFVVLAFSVVLDFSFQKKSPARPGLSA